MEMGDVEPPMQHTSTVLGKAKEESRMLQVGTNITDPLKYVACMKHMLPYVGSNQDIAVDKFNIYNWFPSQMKIYSSYCAQQGSKHCVDATGSLV